MIQKMKRVYPEYYPVFQCLADRCVHNCCIGWEVDIDYSSMRRYQRMQGPMGERLRASIDPNGIYGIFRMTEDGRCPLLNARGLCDLITEKGEKALCQICRDHPRFRFRLSDREEIGLGLCCEAACRLILDWKTPVKLHMTDDGRSKAVLRYHEQEAVRLRDDMIAMAQDRSMPVAERMKRILRKRMIALPNRTRRKWFDLYLSLERMDDAWTVWLRQAKARETSPLLDEIQLEQLLVYFLYRHVLERTRTEGRLYSAVAFSVLSVQMITAICRNPEDIYEVSRLYSEEVEYSDENMEALLDDLECNMEVRP